MAKIGKQSIASASRHRRAVKDQMEKRSFESMRAQMNKAGKYKPKSLINEVLQLGDAKKKSMLEDIRKLIRSNLMLHDSMLDDIEKGSDPDTKTLTKKMKYAIYFVCINQIEDYLQTQMGSRPTERDMKKLLRALGHHMTINELIHHEAIAVKIRRNLDALRASR
jgi:hypothetical protein